MASPDRMKAIFKRGPPSPPSPHLSHISFHLSFTSPLLSSPPSPPTSLLHPSHLSCTSPPPHTYSSGWPSREALVSLQYSVSTSAWRGPSRDFLIKLLSLQTLGMCVCMCVCVCVCVCVYVCVHVWVGVIYACLCVLAWLGQSSSLS